MTKDEIKAYWNYSRVLKTIPEKDYEKPDVQNFLMTYAYLESEFLKLSKKINSQ